MTETDEQRQLHVYMQLYKHVIASLVQQGGILYDIAALAAFVSYKMGLVFNALWAPRKPQHNKKSGIHQNLQGNTI